MTLNHYDTTKLKWTLTGYNPYEWQLGVCREVGVSAKPDIPPLPVQVPGSAQKALLQAGQIPDWNIGLNSREIEWVENRHWLYQTNLPQKWFQPGKRYRLHARGLDHKGQIYLNGREIYRFDNCHIEHIVEITDTLNNHDNLLQILFECPPRWLGQIYRSSKIRDWKPRFYYTWDWTCRMVQIGIWDNIIIEQICEHAIENINVQTDYNPQTHQGSISLQGQITGPDDLNLNIKISDDSQTIVSESVPLHSFRTKGYKADTLEIAPWWPNNLGEQSLYNLEITLTDQQNHLLDQFTRKIGFKNIQWHQCQDAPENATPWLCNINGRDIFIQGVNWTPIRTNFADLTEDNYRKLLEQYHSIGLNTLRVWGGATLEKNCFYDLCDEYGLLVWQEFPLSSSGLDNYPPDDEEMTRQYVEIVDSYIDRLHHHPSLLLWSGGNELTSLEGVPLGLEHPMFKQAHKLIAQKDSQHRFIPTSPSGPSFCASEDNYGKGLHWDVHGPWLVEGSLDEKWQAYWQNDDSLFRSELGAPGPADADLIRQYAGTCDLTPSPENPLWSRTGWWLELNQYIKEKGTQPKTLEEYVQWGQQRQTEILTFAISSCKKRFPRCGGVIIWMGHDSFPCTANTSIIDFNANLKPAAKALAKIFLASPL